MEWGVGDEVEGWGWSGGLGMEWEVGDGGDGGDGVGSWGWSGG